MTLTLVALFPPGSVEAEVGRLQQRIFGEHGLVSAVALPPLVPVAFLPGTGPPRGILPRLNAAVAAPYRIVMTGLSWDDGWLYLELDSGGAWTALRAGAGENDAAGFFPVHEGFFLGCKEASADRQKLILPPVPQGAFTSSRLAAVQIDAAAGEGAWWRRVSMEILEEIPLRGRRRA
jgi:hypothetical protein